MTTLTAGFPTGKSAPVATPAARINSARDAFLGHAYPATLTHLDREYLRGDQASTALHALLAYLGNLAAHDRLSPEHVAEAVEYAVDAGLSATAAVPGLNDVRNGLAAVAS